jgi:hypothetical protein
MKHYVSKCYVRPSLITIKQSCRMNYHKNRAKIVTKRTRELVTFMNISVLILHITISWIIKTFWENQCNWLSEMQDMLMYLSLVLVPPLCFFNWALRHEGLLGEWMYSSTHSLTSALDGGEWSASRPGRFTPREITSGTHWIGCWVGPRIVLDAVVKRKIPSPRRESNPRTPIVQPVAQR